MNIEDTYPLCHNPLKMYPHFIMPSDKPINLFHERLGYCGICWNRAFTDNSMPTNPESVHKSKPYPDSQINNKNFVQCSNDTL